MLRKLRKLFAGEPPPPPQWCGCTHELNCEDYDTCIGPPPEPARYDYDHDPMTAMMPSPDKEQPRDDLDAASVANWSRLAEAKRQRCVQHLLTVVDPGLLDKWADQFNRGVSIGSDDPWFHHGVGMAVRNCLRKVVSDQELPGVDYGNGNFNSNWDDYYIAALQDAASVHGAGQVQSAA